MARPVYLIALGALAGAVAGIVNAGGGGYISALGEFALDVGGSAYRAVANAGPQAKPSAAAPELAAGDSHLIFSACLARANANVETTLRNLLEFHEHDATVALVGCLLDGEPARFCGPAGRRQAGDAMEIYYWSRDDARRSSPAHGMADKIRLLDRAAETGQPAESADPWAMTWSGPSDRAIFDRLRALAKQGYLDPGAFSFSGRAELREALRDVRPEAAPCPTVASAR